MNLELWLRYIEGQHPKEICLGLDRVSAVAQKADVMNFSCKVITVAGTNGKGSTVASLFALLKEAGLQVGTYTSPHLFDFKERIQINGQMVSDAHLCDAFEKIQSSRNDIPLTFFEFTTLAAFYLFQQAPLDVVILEVGLGGQKDAVNLISPDVAIVTSIGLDHQDYLGDTLESIASEKAGIFRENQTALIGKTANIPTLLNKAHAQKVNLYTEGKAFNLDETTGSWKFGNEANIEIKHYLPNTSVSLALAAYTILSKRYFSLPVLERVISSLENVVMVGRCYPVCFNNANIVFDVSHNPQGSMHLAAKLQSLATTKRVKAVWASMQDKDLAGIVKPMKNIVNEWYIGKIKNNERSASSEQLKKALLACNVNNTYAFETIVDAFKSALQSVSKLDIVVVFGSFFTVSQVMEACSLDVNMSHSGLAFHSEKLFS